MKITKVISNTPSKRYMNAQKGIIFNKTVGEVLYGTMLRLDANEEPRIGYNVRVGDIASGKGRLVGSCTDFDIACDMLLQELNLMNVTTA